MIPIINMISTKKLTVMINLYLLLIFMFTAFLRIMATPMVGGIQAVLAT